MTIKTFHKETPFFQQTKKLFSLNNFFNQKKLSHAWTSSHQKNSSTKNSVHK